MKKIVVLTISLIFVALSAQAQKKTITKFEGAEIHGLIVGGAFDIRLSEDPDNTGVSVEIDASSSDKLTFEITDDGIVRIGYGSDMAKYFTSSKNRPMATVTVTDLSLLNISGSCSLIAKEHFTAPKAFAMAVSESAFCAFLDVTCKNGNVSIAGSSKVENFKITDSGKLTIQVEGTSKVELSGSAAQTRMSTSLTSSLDALKFVSPEIQASATGTSLIKANVTGTADVTIGGLSAFKYIGTGKIVGAGAKPL